MFKFRTNISVLLKLRSFANKIILFDPGPSSPHEFSPHAPANEIPPSLRQLLISLDIRSLRGQSHSRARAPLSCQAPPTGERETHFDIKHLLPLIERRIDARATVARFLCLPFSLVLARRSRTGQFSLSLPYFFWYQTWGKEREVITKKNLFSLSLFDMCGDERERE